MKRTTCMLLTALMFLVILSGCQETPENPIVVGKDNEIMLEKAQTDVENEGSTVDLYEDLNAPKSYQDEILSKGERLKVLIDAQVTLPTCCLPIARVATASFTTDNIRKFADGLFGENASYVDMSTENYTKGYYQKEIDRLRSAINEWDTVGSLEYDLVYATKNEAEQGLSELINKAASAPEILPEYTPSFEWNVASSGGTQTNAEDTATNKSMYVYAMPNETTVSRMMVIDHRIGMNQVNLIYERDITNGIGTIISRDTADITNLISIGEAEALQLAEDTISKCGISGFICTGRQQLLYNGNSSKQMPAYRFMFTRQVNGASVTFTNADYSRSDGEEKPWQYEKINILVNDNGVEFFQYSGPVDVLEIVMQNTQLLGFPDIQAIFEKMIVIVNNTVDSDSQESTVRLEYHISEIILGLMCVREQNCDTGLLIPVWDFRGYEYVSGDIEGSYLVESNGYKSFLTINAIDGSIIDRSSGY